MKVTREQRYLMQLWLDEHDVEDPKEHLEYFAAIKLLMMAGANVIYKKFNRHIIEHLDELPDTVRLEVKDARYAPGIIKFLAYVGFEIQITIKET